MLRHAFDHVRRVVFLIGPQNVRSQRAVEKTGAVRTRERRKASGVVSYAYVLEASRFEAG